MINYFGDIDDILRESSPTLEYNEPDLLILEREFSTALAIQRSYNELMESTILNEGVLSKIWQWIKDMLTKAKNFFVGLFKSTEVKDINSPQSEAIIKETAKEIIAAKDEKPSESKSTSTSISSKDEEKEEPKYEESKHERPAPHKNMNARPEPESGKEKHERLMAQKAEPTPKLKQEKLGKYYYTKMGEKDYYGFIEPITKYNSNYAKLMDVVKENDKEKVIRSLFVSANDVTAERMLGDLRRSPMTDRTLGEVLDRWLEVIFTNSKVGPEVTTTINGMLSKVDEMSKRDDIKQEVIQTASLMLNCYLTFVKESLTFALRIKREVLNLGRKHKDSSKIKDWNSKIKENQFNILFEAVVMDDEDFDDDDFNDEDFDDEDEEFDDECEDCYIDEAYYGEDSINVKEYRTLDQKVIATVRESELDEVVKYYHMAGNTEFNYTDALDKVAEANEIESSELFCIMESDHTQRLAIFNLKERMRQEKDPAKKEQLRDQINKMQKVMRLKKIQMKGRTVKPAAPKTETEAVSEALLLEAGFGKVGQFMIANPTIKAFAKSIEKDYEKGLKTGDWSSYKSKCLSELKAVKTSKDAKALKKMVNISYLTPKEFAIYMGLILPAAGVGGGLIGSSIVTGSVSHAAAGYGLAGGSIAGAANFSKFTKEGRNGFDLYKWYLSTFEDLANARIRELKDQEKVAKAKK